MSSFKHIFSTFILASIAFIIPGSQMFGDADQPVAISIATEKGPATKGSEIFDSFTAGVVGGAEGKKIYSTGTGKILYVGKYGNGDKNYYIEYTDQTDPTKPVKNRFEFKILDAKEKITWDKGGAGVDSELSRRNDNQVIELNQDIPEVGKSGTSMLTLNFYIKLQ